VGARLRIRFPGLPPEDGRWVSVTVLGASPCSGGGAGLPGAFRRHEWRRSAASFTASEPKIGRGASSGRLARPKPELLPRRVPVVCPSPKRRTPVQGAPGVQVCKTPRRSGTPARPSAKGCLPPVPHRGGARVQDTQRGKDDLSHGVRSPSAFRPGRSLRRFTSPAPSALRVSHSLSGLSPPGSRGFVSRHIRPWGLVPASRAFPVRPAVAPLDVRCPLAVPAAELSLDGGRLQGVAPAERPFPGGRG
jgi:hypothetical protein